MESKDRNAPLDVGPMDRLRARPYEFDFYFALRVLENELWESKDEWKKMPRIGTSEHAAQDPVRFGQTASLRFAPTTITHFGLTKDASKPKLDVAFLGLFGPNGPLPLHLTQHAFYEAKNKNPVFARFADMFHHRMISLFYRAWAVAQPTVQFDRPDKDRFGGFVGSLFGMGTPLSRNRDSVPDQAKFYFAGLFASQARNAEGLTTIIANFFGVPVLVKEFQKQTLRIPPHTYFRLGISGSHNSLGVNTIAGKTVTDCESTICIQVGPLKREAFDAFLPGSPGLVQLADLVRTYTNDQWTWQLQLSLNREDASGMRLGQSGQLGWTSWLGQSHPSGTDPCVVLNQNSGNLAGAIRHAANQGTQTS